MKSKLALIAMLLSTASVALTAIINVQIANRYLEADGKTKAMFGIIELMQFGYQNYVSILGFIAVILGIKSYRASTTKGEAILAITLGIIAMVLVFVKVWRLFI